MTAKCVPAWRINLQQYVYLRKLRVFYTHTHIWNLSPLILATTCRNVNPQCKIYDSAKLFRDRAAEESGKAVLCLDTNVVRRTDKVVDKIVRTANLYVNSLTAFVFVCWHAVVICCSVVRINQVITCVLNPRSI